MKVCALWMGDGFQYHSGIFVNIKFWFSLHMVKKAGRHITVSVGSIFHPMTEEHSITWIYLLTQTGCQRVNLERTGEPVAHFFLLEGVAANPGAVQPEGTGAEPGAGQPEGA